MDDDILGDIRRIAQQAAEAGIDFEELVDEVREKTETTKSGEVKEKIAQEVEPPKV